MHHVSNYLENDFLQILHQAVAPVLFVENSDLGTRGSLLNLPELCCAAVYDRSEVATAFNTTWQVLYTALHILDTVEDNDTTQALWSRWGSGASINISTGLLAQVGLTLVELEQRAVPSEVAHQLRSDVYSTLLRMASGQHADLTFTEPGLDHCWSIAEAKSGAFFALGCRAGARLANVPAERVAQFGQYGASLGMLIQIGDDLDALSVNNTSSQDVRIWPRWTLPVAYAMSVTSEKEKDDLRSLLQHAVFDSGAAAKVRTCVLECGAAVYLAVEAQRYHQRAVTALFAATEPSPARDQLNALLFRCSPLVNM